MPSYTRTTLVESPEEVRERTPGGGDGAGGRRPPEDTKYTGGGGEGDDYSSRGEGHRGPRETLHRHRLSLFAILVGDTMFFIGAIGVFLVNKSAYHVNSYNNIVQEWRPIAIPPILWLNTAVLLLSGITMEMARRGMFRENELLEEWLGLGRPVTKRILPWLIATLFLGFTFLGGQFVAWRQLMSGPLGYTGLSKQDFYLLTGLHAAHVLIGLLAIAACIISMRQLRKLELRQVLVDCTAWFWHAMGVFWIALFVLLEWFQ